MRIPLLALFALLSAPTPSSAQLPVIVLPNDPTVHEDRVGVNHFITALRALDVDVVEYLQAGEVALEVVVQYVRRDDRQFHVVVMAISYVRRLPDRGESRTRPALAVNSGSGELENLIRGMAEDVHHFLDQSDEGSDPFDDPAGRSGGARSSGDQGPGPMEGRPMRDTAPRAVQVQALSEPIDREVSTDLTGCLAPRR